jgi:hypothetical protein
MIAIEIEDKIKTLSHEGLPKTADCFFQFAMMQQEAARVNEEWTDFSLKNFAMAYGDDEPEYSIADITK